MLEQCAKLRKYLKDTEMSVPVPVPTPGAGAASGPAIGTDAEGGGGGANGMQEFCDEDPSAMECKVFD